MQDLTGVAIAHYRLQRLLAQGGMSSVYLAHDTQKNIPVAIKLVHDSNDEYCKRFRREAQTMAKLRHDHILPAFDYDKYHEWCYMVMPYIKDGTLRDLLSKGPLPLPKTALILEQLASALQFAHERGIVHRDIKPSNVLLRDGEHVYLADFGIVKVLGERTNITQTGVIMATPDYMAPELVYGPATASSDIYALGVMLYQMVTDQLPFKSSTPVGICWKHIHEQPVPPSVLNPDIPLAVEQVILCALEKEPDNRFVSVKELAHAYHYALQRDVMQPTITITPVKTAYADSIAGPRLSSFKHSMQIGMLVAVATLLLFVLPTVLGFSLYTLNMHPADFLGSSGSFISGSIPGVPQRRPHQSTIPTTAPIKIRQATPTPTRVVRSSDNVQNRGVNASSLESHSQTNVSSNNGNNGQSNTKGNNGKGKSQGNNEEAVNNKGNGGNKGNSDGSNKGNEKEKSNNPGHGNGNEDGEGEGND